MAPFTLLSATPVAANDAIRPLATVELSLRLKPTSGAGVWRLDPQYRAWMAQSFPAERFHLCPLEAYDRLVRPADGELTLEALDARLSAEARRLGGYRLEGLSRWWPRTAMFVVGSRSARALVDFLFAWG